MNATDTPQPLDPCCVRCTVCSADAGSPCVSLRGNGRPVKNPHGPRESYARLRRTLEILRDHGPMGIQDFAKRMWPERVKRMANTQASGFAASGYLAKLEGEGMMRHRPTHLYGDEYRWDWSLTDAGRKLVGKDRIAT